jgi:D-glycero-alpha-D-manno-heptose-7-phosphate kinase
MIISRTPFRISFFGGGTDYPVWYRKHGGAVIATSINKYCYINCRYLPPFFPYNYRIRYTKSELTQTIDEIAHPSVRECLKFTQIKRGVEIQHNADLPAMSGLGSSSTFTVSLLHTLHSLKGNIINKQQLALDAIYVEQDMIRENVGSQDQVSAAFGGFNKITFDSAENILVQPITLSGQKLTALQDHLLLFYTGFQRTASEIVGKQIERTPEREAELRRMMELVDEAMGVLNRGMEEIEDFGRLLHEQWMVKRSLTDLISNPVIDEMYETGRRAGAIGGKLLGAGGGGFLLFFVRPDERTKVKEALKKLLHVPFRFENLGSQIIYYAPEDNNHEV